MTIISYECMRLCNPLERFCFLLAVQSYSLANLPEIDSKNFALVQPTPKPTNSTCLSGVYLTWEPAGHVSRSVSHASQVSLIASHATINKTHLIE